MKAMESYIAKQQDSENMTNVMVSIVEQKNGNKTQLLTFFNSQHISFEDVNIGIKETLSGDCDNIAVQNQLYMCKNGVFDFFTEYKKQPLQAVKVANGSVA